MPAQTESRPLTVNPCSRPPSSPVPARRRVVLLCRSSRRVRALAWRPLLVPTGSCVRVLTAGPGLTTAVQKGEQPRLPYRLGATAAEFLPLQLLLLLSGRGRRAKAENPPPSRSRTRWRRRLRRRSFRGGGPQALLVGPPRPCRRFGLRMMRPRRSAFIVFRSSSLCGTAVVGLDGQREAASARRAEARRLV
jgi:hypothetical protein